MVTVCYHQLWEEADRSSAGTQSMQAVLGGFELSTCHLLLLDFVLKWLKKTHTLHSAFVSVREVKTSTGTAENKNYLALISSSLHIFLNRETKIQTWKPSILLGESKFNLVQKFWIVSSGQLWRSLLKFSSLLQEFNTRVSLWFVWASNRILNPLTLFLCFCSASSSSYNNHSNHYKLIFQQPSVIVFLFLLPVSVCHYCR